MPADVNSSSDGSGSLPDPSFCFAEARHVNPGIDGFLQSLLAGPYGNLVCILSYGGNGGFDDDFVVVYDSLFVRSGLTLGRADLLVTDVAMLSGLIERYDPIATEPVLTGHYCCGEDSGLLASMMSYLTALTPSPLALQHLEACSRRCFEIARALLESHPAQHRAIAVEAMHALSYWFLARHYSAHRIAPVSVQEVLNSQSDRIHDLWRDGKVAKRGGIDLRGYVAQVGTVIATS